MKRLPWFVKRNTLTALALIAGLSLGAQAALAEPSKHHSQRWDYIFTQLDITEEQQAQVHTLFKEMATERRAEMKAQREERKRYHEANEGQYEDRSARRDAWQTERQVRREQARQNLSDRLGTILAPDQVEGLVTYMDAHKPGHKHQGARHHKKRGERMHKHRQGGSN